MLDVIQEELAEIKRKHGRKRMTEISEVEAVDFNREELIQPADVVVTMSRNGYLKRVTLDTYRAQGAAAAAASSARTPRTRTSSRASGPRTRTTRSCSSRTWGARSRNASSRSPS